MKAPSSDLLLKFAMAGAVVLGVVYLAKKAASPESLGQAVGGAATDAVIGVASGVVNHTGAAFGIPMQNDQQCRLDLLRGDKLAAMSSCRVGDFASYLWDGTIPNTNTPPPTQALPIEYGISDPMGNW